MVSAFHPDSRRGGLDPQHGGRSEFSGKSDLICGHGMHIVAVIKVDTCESRLWIHEPEFTEFICTSFDRM